MIVDPDFFDHWRTRMVVDALGGDEMAPMYIMRLWSHCQNRKGDRFVIPSAGIKALCKYPGNAEAFEKALIDAEFLSRDGASITVEGWAERNASLIAAWENGVKGGRPKKPTDNPQETHGKPNGNPAVTQTEPMGNPGETDKIREDKNTSSLRSDVARKPRPTKRCPAEFVVTDDMARAAKAECPGVDLQRETIKFRDHEFKQAHSDWPATWRNWMRNAQDRLPTARASPGFDKPPTSAELRLFNSSPAIMDPVVRSRCEAYTGTKPKAEVIEMETGYANAISMD